MPAGATVVVTGTVSGVELLDEATESGRLDGSEDPLVGGLEVELRGVVVVADLLAEPVPPQAARRLSATSPVIPQDMTF
jgi:hypothetical protein